MARGHCWGVRGERSTLATDGVKISGFQGSSFRVLVVGFWLLVSGLGFGVSSFRF